MNCTEVRSRLAGLEYGDLPTDEANAVRAHLVYCPDCQAEQARLTQVRSLLDEAPTSPVRVDLPRLYREAADQQMRRLRRLRRLAFAAVAAAAVIVIGVFLSRIEVRLDSGQLVVRWGTVPAREEPAPPPSVPSPAPPTVAVSPVTSTADLEQQLYLLTELVQAISNDADLRDEKRQRELSVLRTRVQALQEQLTELRLTTEKDVSALYSAQFPNSKEKGD
jgi:hypothetical protein